MPPQFGCPDEQIRRTVSSASVFKPPLPTQRIRFASQQASQVEIQLPPLVAGALVAAFAQAVVDGLNNELLTHYYLSDLKIRINLDRVVDRLLDGFAKDIWDELFHFYHESTSPPSRQVTLLFDGPIRQIVLILNGPETACCILHKLAPGLSRRRSTWSERAMGIDLPLALQLACGWWHRTFPARSPGGVPNEIARAIHARMVGGRAAENLIASIRKTLMTPHMVQMHIVESAMWDILVRRPFRPPVDGFNIVHFRFECRTAGAQDYAGGQTLDVGSLPTITGTVNDCCTTTVKGYTSKQWPGYGGLVLGCLQQAVAAALEAARQGQPLSGMSLWDDSEGKDLYCSGLRLLHLEIEESMVQVTVSAWTHALLSIFQQMAWTCAALSASPFPGVLSECAVEISDWRYLDDSISVDCSLAHRAVPHGDGPLWLQQYQGATIATGFPLIHDAVNPIEDLVRR